ncbi:unnamed protein product [Closterium sp. Naga37s-1]|nr:unnamed protein product [Closterium sp. Naga37s-1]
MGDSLPCLRKLTIRNCKSLTHLPPDGFSSLRHLESLTLDNCNLLFSLPEIIGFLPRLNTLVLQDLPLDYLPDSLCQAASLENLFLIKCYRISRFPEGFCSLPALKTLCLVQVLFLKLPADLGSLTSLQTLFVKSNSGKQLPSTFTRLVSLRRLKLDGCCFFDLPESVHELRNLTELHLCFCPNFRKLPESITRLSNLESLTVNGCGKLCSVPRSLLSLGKLKRLEIGELQVPSESLPPFLQVISLFSLPRSLLSLGKLKWLEMGECDQLQVPPESLPPSLEVISLGTCEHSIPLPDVSNLPKLTKLGLNLVGAGDAVRISSSVPHLKHLNLILTAEAEELSFPLSACPQLRTLEISRAGRIERLPETIGSAVKQLRCLRIDCFPKLKALPDSITELQNLSELEVFAAESLVALPAGIGALSRLRSLILFGCPALEYLPSSLTQLTRLHRLAIKASAIRFLPPSFAQLTKLKTLTLQLLPQNAPLPGRFLQPASTQDAVPRAGATLEASSRSWKAHQSANSFREGQLRKTAATDIHPADFPEEIGAG